MRLKLYILFIIVLGYTVSLAQKKQNLSREQLESQRSSLLNEIKNTQNELNELRKDKKASLAELQALQSKLNARNKLIENINHEISIIELSIAAANNDVVILKTKLDTLKKQYAEMVRYTYKNKTSSDFIVFLFSSTSFNDAIRRLNYVKQYRGFRADQAVKITSASKQLSNKINVLNIERQKKDMVLTAQQSQNKILEIETKEKDKIVSELKGKEKELTADLAKKKKAADDLNKAIATAIKYEIDMAMKRAEAERKKQLQIQKDKEEAERKAAIDKRRKEVEEFEKQKREEAAKKLAKEKEAQAEKEKQALIEKQKREEQERKLAQEQKEREQKEKALALEKKEREEAEKKAAKMAEEKRQARELELAEQKRKQEEQEKALALEKKKQEDKERQLLQEKQKQEEEQRRLAEEKRRQEREQQRIASNTPYNNPRYVPDADKPKYGDVMLNTGSSEGGTVSPVNRGPKKDANPAENNTKLTASETEKVNIKTFKNDDYMYSLTPTERELSANFELNKGKLPWPVEKGYIVEHFGKNKHPLFNIQTENYGIDIKTNKAANARAVFAGEVSSVINIPGTGTTVIINHGSFFTVYAKLSSTNVKKGSRVTMKQNIGTVMTDDDGNTQINFQVWKIGSGGSSSKLNPEHWIALY